MDRALGLIGLAHRAGRVASGSELCEAAVRDGSAKLVIAACDISGNGKKAITDCCRYYNVPCISYATKAELGRAIGREFRAVVAICDAGFAASLENRIAESMKERKV